MLSNGRFVSMSSIYELKTKSFLIRMQLMKLYKEQPELTSQFDVSKVQKQPSSDRFIWTSLPTLVH